LSQNAGLEEIAGVVETEQFLSAAESMWNRRNRRKSKQSQMDTDSTTLETTDSISEAPEVIQRLAYVIDQILDNAPVDVRGSIAFKTVAAMIQEARKDLRRLPEDQVEEFARMVGQAFLWVADGDIAEVTPETEAEDGA
jgi:phosphoserine phosphatase